MPPASDAAGHQRGEAAVDGCCRLGRELLAGDRADERREVIGALRGSKATWPMPPDQRRQHRIATQQETPRAAVVGRSHGVPIISPTHENGGAATRLSRLDVARSLLRQEKNQHGERTNCEARCLHPVAPPCWVGAFVVQCFCGYSYRDHPPRIDSELVFLVESRCRRPVPRHLRCWCRPSARGADDDWQFRPCGRHHALLRSSTRARCLSGAQPCHPCWQSRAACVDPSTQIHDLPWPRCPPLVRSGLVPRSRFPWCLSPRSPTECNRGATTEATSNRKLLIG